MNAMAALEGTNLWEQMPICCFLGVSAVLLRLSVFPAKLYDSQMLGLLPKVTLPQIQRTWEEKDKRSRKRSTLDLLHEIPQTLPLRYFSRLPFFIRGFWSC